MSDLLAFQDAFASAMAGEAVGLTPWLGPDPERHAGLAVYRNTITRGCVDALAANFPTVLGLVGEDWFRAAAALFAREAPPTHAALLNYGEDFPAWLDRFPPARDLPYLAGVAHLDRLWIETLFEAEAPVLAAAALAALSPESLAGTRVTLHPAVRIAAFEAALPSLWVAARLGRETLELADRVEGLLLCRPGSSVVARVIGPADVAFLTGCRARLPLAEAINLAAEADPAADLQTLFATLIADGVFRPLDNGTPT